MIPRTRYEIIEEILDVCKDGARKSHIVYRANLNFEIIKKYLETLLKKGLLIQEKSWYYTTDKGANIFQKLNTIIIDLQ